MHRRSRSSSARSGPPPAFPALDAAAPALSTSRCAGNSQRRSGAALWERCSRSPAHRRPSLRAGPATHSRGALGRGGHGRRQLALRRAAERTMSWLWALVAYLCGSIPFGLLIAKAATGSDVRAAGSGNIGATNVARVAGRPAAIATLVLDALKGLVPVLIAARLGLRARRRDRALLSGLARVPVRKGRGHWARRRPGPRTPGSRRRSGDVARALQSVPHLERRLACGCGGHACRRHGHGRPLRRLWTGRGGAHHRAPAPGEHPPLAGPARWLAPAAAGGSGATLERGHCHHVPVREEEAEWHRMTAAPAPPACPARPTPASIGPCASTGAPSSPAR